MCLCVSSEVCAWVCVIGEVCACVRVAVSSHAAPSALSVLGSLAWPWVRCARGPPPSLLAQTRRGCVGTGVADGCTGPTDRVECRARPPPPAAPRLCPEAAPLSPRPSRLGLSPILALTWWPQGSPPESTARPLGCPPPTGRIHRGPSTVPSSRVSPKGSPAAGESMESGLLGAAVPLRSSAAGPASALCALSRWTHPWGERPCGLWDSPGRNAGMGSLSCFQGIFPTQGSNPGLRHCRRSLYRSNCPVTSSRHPRGLGPPVPWTGLRQQQIRGHAWAGRGEGPRCGRSEPIPRGAVGVWGRGTPLHVATRAPGRAWNCSFLSCLPGCCQQWFPETGPASSRGQL